MPFQPPSWVPALNVEEEIPESLSIADFFLDERYGRLPYEQSRPPFIDSQSGKAPSIQTVNSQVDYLARGLVKEFGWQTSSGTQWDKVVGVFSENTIDLVPLSWAVFKIDGIVTPANAQFSASELHHQLKDSGAKCLFTCRTLLDTALKAAKDSGLPKNRVYLLGEPAAGQAKGLFKTTNQLIELGKTSPELDRLAWQEGDAKRKIAYLCYSSGTSGLPKGVLIAHYSVIANTIQFCKHEHFSRQQREKPPGTKYKENVLGLLPLSHIYGLVVIAHCSVYRGDSVIILPRFNLRTCLQAIQRYNINTLYLVPPIIVLFTKNHRLLAQYDLSSVQAVFTGAATLGRETAEALGNIFPMWRIRQAYGLTETCTVVSASSDHDIWFGSAGSLIPGLVAKLVSPSGDEITTRDQAGELWVTTPSLVLGYLDNQKANEETFITDKEGNRWMRTGDEVVIKKAPSGNDHLFIVDRIKELIKVKGFQVAPAELEAHLLTYPLVVDCAVIPVPDDKFGEVPKAYIVKKPGLGNDQSDSTIAAQIIKYVRDHKSRPKWLAGGVEFIDVVPKSPSGKILRRLLRDKEKERRKGTQTKL